MRAESDHSSGELLRRADIAMYQAKLGLEGAVLYDSHHDDFSRPRLQLAEELRRGIPSGQLVLWYQPQIDSSTMQVCGLEALIRWNHPTHGMLSPAEFLPVARRAGLMLMLSDEVARHAVAAAKRLNSHGLHQRIAINCAPPELLSGFFIPRLYNALDSADVPASSLIVEITEDSLLADPVRARTILQEMREHGLQISIDDYGTGFSSLSYLRDLPVEELKIDRSFIATTLTDQRSRTIVESTLQMAHGLGLRIVAEGVEDSPTASELVAMGVDVLQGYHIARPMPLGDVQAGSSEWSAVAEEGAWRPRLETAELFAPRRPALPAWRRPHAGRRSQQRCGVAERIRSRHCHSVQTDPLTDEPVALGVDAPLRVEHLREVEVYRVLAADPRYGAARVPGIACVITPTMVSSRRARSSMIMTIDRI